MSTKKTKKSRKKSKKKNQVPYHRKPENMSLEAWQLALRKQFGRDSNFEVEQHAEHPVYGDYSVHNPVTDSTYKVALRNSPKEVEQGINNNFCSCYDFKTNQLGTCKHIEAVLGRKWRNTRLRRYFKDDWQPAYSSVYLKYGSERKAMIRVGTEKQEAFERLANQYFDENKVLKPRAFASFDKFLEKARSLDTGFRCYDDALAFVIEQRQTERRQQLLKDKIKNIKSKYFDDLIKADLYPYQRECVYFAARAGRCLIADEMGLGKTIQALAATELMKKELGISRVLIICPTSLKYQWQSEIGKFTDSSSLVIEGNPLARIPQYQEDESFYKIVSYYTAGRDLKHINAQDFDLIILDEAQRIKNWQAKISQNIKKIQSTYAIVLTGTPLENKLEELYSIMQFIDPFLLGSLYSFLDKYQITNETGKVVGYQHLNEIGEVLKNVLIRRTRKQVLTQLPARRDKNLFVPMTEQQHQVHQEFADQVARLVHKWRRMGFLQEKDRQRLLISLNMMRMSCNSTYIIDQRTRHDTKIDELMSILEEILDLQEEKVVIFSQWERMTRIVAGELDELGVRYEYLHGGVPSVKRKDLYKNFNQDPETRVFLSTDAGGVGLNLQAASYMVNLDIPWNPAVLEQRIARIYRMGQRRKVSIINLVSTGTIEHRMLDVLKFKSSMAGGVLDRGEDAIFMSEDRFKQFMNSVENVVADTAESTPLSDAGFVEQQEEKEAMTSPEESTHEVTAALFMEESTEEEERGKQGVGSKQEQENSQREPVMEGPELLSSGLSFFSQLSRTLQDPEATRKLVNSVTEKDSSNGKTYLKIPVEDEKVVEEAMSALGTFFKMLQK